MSNGSSIITLRKEAVKNNIRFIRRHMGKNVRISSVVKANAYGHGINQLVPLLENEGINHFSVFDYQEAASVASCLTNPSSSIMIMGYISEEEIHSAIINGYEFYVFTVQRLKAAIKKAKQLNIKAKIHIEVETGMNRSGIKGKALTTLIRLITEHRETINIQGLCTHLAGAESVSNHVRLQQQLKKFELIKMRFREAGIVARHYHVANSAAAFVYPESRMNMVRIGIIQYGFWPSPEVFIRYINSKKNKSDPLRRILGWKSSIMEIKKVQIGEFIGYGNSYLAQKPIKTALVPVGYAQGYHRSLSNRGRVLIRGIRCGLVGLVNMNMILADISEIPDAQIGDEVILIGQQGELEIKVSAFSNISNKLNYEVLTHLPRNIERIII